MDIIFHSDIIPIGAKVLDDDFGESRALTMMQAISCGMYVTLMRMDTRIKYDDLIACKDLIHRFPMHTFAYFSVPPLHDQCIILNELEYSMFTLAHLAAPNSGVIVDCDLTGGDQMTLTRLLKQLQFKFDYHLLIENTASGAGTSVHDLFVVHSGCSRRGQKFNFGTADVGVCLNFAKFFAAGLYRFDSAESVKKLFFDYDNLFLVQPALVVLEDSASAFGGGKYDPIELAAGLMLTAGHRDVLLEILHQCYARSIPILTLTTGDVDYLHELKTMITLR